MRPSRRLIALLAPVARAGALVAGASPRSILALDLPTLVTRADHDRGRRRRVGEGGLGRRRTTRILTTIDRHRRRLLEGDGGAGVAPADRAARRHRGRAHDDESTACRTSRRASGRCVFLRGKRRARQRRRDGAGQAPVSRDARRPLDGERARPRWRRFRAHHAGFRHPSSPPGLERSRICAATCGPWSSAARPAARDEPDENDDHPALVDRGRRVGGRLLGVAQPGRSSAM